MKLLCNHPTRVHGLDGSFPSITQVHYNAYNINDEENTPGFAHSIKCNDSKLILKSVHLWNQQSTGLQSLKRSPRDTHRAALRQPQDHENLTSADAEVHTNIISKEEKQQVLATLHTYMLRAQNLGTSNLFLPREKESIRGIILEQALGKIYDTIKNVRAATTREKVGELLHALHEQVTNIVQAIQDVILPPLAEKFENQSASIWLETDSFLTELSELGLEQPLSHALRVKSLNYIRTLISDIEKFKSLSAGNLSAEFIRRLQAGFEERKSVLLQASRQIEAAANNNREIHAILKNLRATVARYTRQERFHPILASPQRLYLQRSRFFKIPLELRDMQSRLTA